MVDLPSTPISGVTSEAPRSAISPGQIAAPYQQMGDALDKIGDGLSKTAVPLAKQQAANDLLKQKITRNADGSVNVENPASAPLLFGEAGKAYVDAVNAGTIAQHGNLISQDLTDLHQKFPTDPQGFRAASEAYFAKRSSDLTGPVGEAIQREGAQLQTQHLNAITNAAATNDVENQKKSILAQVDDKKNTMDALARQGGTNTPEFQEAAKTYSASLNALAGNPLFKMPQEMIDLQVKHTAALMQGEALNASLDSTFNKRNGKAEAQKVLTDHILNNPDLEINDKNRLYTQGMARLQYLTADAKEGIDSNRKNTELLETNLANGKVKPEDPVVGMAINHALDIGDVESAKRIGAAYLTAPHLRTLDTLPDAIKSEVLGVPGPAGNGPVNTSIPPEGRALLKTIGSTESANRYNVRYDGGGGRTFADYSDHPRIAAPITSGPDIGKTSSAAGYYQFIGSTWDQQKNKLGLKDFSPANQDAAAWDLAQTTYKQKTGKDLLTVLKSGDATDVLPSLSGQWSSLPGGRQPANGIVAPSANGGPGFTADQARQNPFLVSAYVRAIAADPEGRVTAAKQTASAINTALDKGILPSPSSAAEVYQAAQLHPDKMGNVADDIRGRLQGSVAMALPQEQRDAYFKSITDAAQGQDIHQTNLAASALKQRDEQNKNMAEHPYDEGARRGWTSPAVPIDPAQPNTIASALVQRAGLSARIGQLNHTPPPPLLDKDEMPKLQTALQGPNGTAVLGQIGQGLRPDEMHTLLQEDGFRSSVTGMSRSGDPAKMNAAYSFMDTQQKQNPLEFEKQFPDGLKDLRSWQSNLAFYPPDVAAKRLLQAYDPAQSSGLKAADEVAHKALETVSADAVVSKFSTGWGPIGTGAHAPVSDQAGVAKGALKADYDQNYRDGFAATGDATMADKFAMEKLNLKYAVSPTNGNKIMANAPERYYPQVGGSHDWMSQQLDEAVAKQLGVQSSGGAYDKNLPPGALYGDVKPGDTFGDETPGERRYNARRALVSDQVTDRDIASGKPPSYQVIVQDNNGRWSALTGSTVEGPNTVQRFRFDPTTPFAERAAKANEARTVMQAVAGSEQSP